MIYTLTFRSCFLILLIIAASASANPLNLDAYLKSYAEEKNIVLDPNSDYSPRAQVSIYTYNETENKEAELNLIMDILGYRAIETDALITTESLENSDCRSYPEASWEDLQKLRFSNQEQIKITVGLKDTDLFDIKNILGFMIRKYAHKCSITFADNPGRKSVTLYGTLDELRQAIKMIRELDYLLDTL